MSENLPQFDRAEYITAVDPQLVASYEAFRSDTSEQRTESALFTHALLYGLLAAIVGGVLYAAFTIVTHIEIGYVAIGVGYLVGKAMLAATNGLGGRRYQIAAAVLTYLSVSMAFVPETLYALHQKGFAMSHISVRGWVILAGYGVASPFLGLSEGVGGLLGLFILFIGIRAAWGLAAGRRANG